MNVDLIGNTLKYETFFIEKSMQTKQFIYMDQL